MGIGREPYKGNKDVDREKVGKPSEFRLLMPRREREWSIVTFRFCLNEVINDLGDRVVEK